MKMCLVGVLGSALLRAGTGGSEKQIALLARHLVRRGHCVTLLVTDHVGPDVRVNGVTLKAAWDPRGGVPRMRALTHRYPALFRRLLREEADLYYVRGAVPFSPVVLHAARRAGSPGVLGLASDLDLLPESGRVVLGLDSSRAHRVASCAGWLGLQRHALRTAAAVVAQNREQAAMGAALGLRRCVLIPSIVDDPPEGLLAVEPTWDVVWVGNVGSGARRSKGVGTLADVASRLPTVRFVVVGGLTATSVRTAHSRLLTMPNITLLGPQPYEETQRVIARARAVLNTSPAEGFSNVMLEGWALGKPAFTLSVNPNGLLGETGLGRCAEGSPDMLSELLGRFLTDQVWLEAAGRRARDYVQAVHGADPVCLRYEELAMALS